MKAKTDKLEGGSKTYQLCGMSQQQTFEILEVQTREYSRFNMLATQWNVRLNPPPVSETTPPPDPLSHFVDSVNDLFDYVLENVGDTDIVGIIIQNEANQSDKSMGFSFRRKDQLSSDVMCSVFDKISQSNSRFNVLDTLIVTVHSVIMQAGF